VWVKAAAISPVPSYAVVHAPVLEAIETELAVGSEKERAEIDEAFLRFERTQPHLAERIAQMINRPLDETALALGYFLTIAVWMSFERSFGPSLGQVKSQDLKAVEASFELEEQLRATHGEQPMDVDDVVSLEQPSILEFIHGHVEAALDLTAQAEVRLGEPRDVDVDDVHSIYRMVVILTLALSHAVRPGPGVSSSPRLPD
jgi:hypothetical protein